MDENLIEVLDLNDMLNNIDEIYETVEVDSNGNWSYPFFINNIEYVIWNETRIFHNAIQVGTIHDGEINFY
jgi:hypothetical protein